MGYDRYCDMCGEGMYHADGFMTGLGHICKSCFKEHILDDITLDEWNNIIDDGYFESIEEVFNIYDVYDLASTLNIDIVFGERFIDCIFMHYICIFILY